MTPTLRDMCCALPTVKYNISTLNRWGITVVAGFFLSACITVSSVILLYRWACG